MSQRKERIEKVTSISIKIDINLKSFSNHDGFINGQIERAKKEFEEKIKQHLIGKLADDYNMEDFLSSVDYVNYEVFL